MKIVQFSPGIVETPPQEGGAIESHIFNLSKCLARHGQDVTIIDKKYEKHEPDEEYISRVRILRLPVLSLSMAISKAQLNSIFNEVLFASHAIRKIGKEIFKAEVIHAHTAYVGAQVALARKKWKGKYIYTCHNGGWCNQNAGLYEKLIVRPLERLAINATNASIAVSKNLREGLVRLGGIPSHKIVTISNGVDTDYFSPTNSGDRAKLLYDLDGSEVVLFVGLVTPEKGVEFLIEAANILVRQMQFSHVKFLLVGPVSKGYSLPTNMKYRHHLVRLVKRLGLMDNVVFTGSATKEELRSLYACCSLFVMPSLFDAQPLALLEAMASGKPVIGSGVGGITNVIENNWNGFIVSAGNSKELAERIALLLSCEEVREEMGRRSRKIAEELYSWESVSQRTLALYCSLDK